MNDSGITLIIIMIVAMNSCSKLTDINDSLKILAQQSEQGAITDDNKQKTIKSNQEY